MSKDIIDLNPEEIAQAMKELYESRNWQVLKMIFQSNIIAPLKQALDVEMDKIEGKSLAKIEALHYKIKVYEQVLAIPPAFVESQAEVETEPERDDSDPYAQTRAEVDEDNERERLANPVVDK
jgi:hypothetical protein